jgi:hypothetical protein
MLRSVIRAPVFLPAVLAALTRTTLFLVADRHPGRFLSRDSLGYDRLARHFSTAYLHTRSGGLFDLSLLRPPGYPAFVAVVYALTDRVVAHVIAVEVVLGVATVVLTYYFARDLVGSTAAALAAFVLAIDPVSIAMSSYLTTEVLFAFLWVAAAYAWSGALELEDPWWGVATGLLFGLSALVRPIAAYLPVLLVPLTLLVARRPHARRGFVTAALLVGFAVPVGGWLARNTAETGVATVSTVQSRDLLSYRAAGALAADTGVSIDTAASELEREVAARTHPGENAAEISRVQNSIAWRTLLHHPAGALITTIEGLGKVLFGPGRAQLLLPARGYTSPRDAADRVLLLAAAGVLFATLALAAVGVVVLARSRSWLPLACTLTFVLYDIVLASGSEGNGRLRMPAMPFVAVLSGVGGVWLIGWASTWSRAKSASRSSAEA